MKNKQQDLKEVLELILEIRGLEKLLSTYYDGVEDLIYPDSCLRTQFQHVSTQTGRLSSTNPNIQNQPSDNKIIKEHFTTRYEDGHIVVGDYKSLEPRTEAQLSGDLQLITDTQNGVCPHTKHLALKKRVSYEEAVERVESGEWKDERRRVKAFTFGLQFKAGNKTVSRNSGMSEEEIEDLRAQRLKEYPRLHLYYDYIFEEVTKKGEYKDPFGVRYCFKKYPPKFRWQKVDQYSPQEIQNHKTQGFAGSINLLMLGVFWRKKGLHSREKYVMVNTVHDSLVLDCQKEYLAEAREDLKILEEVQEVCRDFDYQLKVDFPIDVQSGKAWSDC